MTPQAERLPDVEVDVDDDREDEEDKDDRGDCDISDSGVGVSATITGDGNRFFNMTMLFSPFSLHSANSFFLILSSRSQKMASTKVKLLKALIK